MLAEDPVALDRRICVAPMMDYTDRHCRYFMRLLSPSALLYTEMVTAKALVHGNPERLLGFDTAEQPVALQLGGSDPDELAHAARLGQQFGYREINLNCGCPSDRVKSGHFGACLMAEAARVRDCVSAMRAVVQVPVTVKCRIGIEPGMAGRSDLEFLREFIATVTASGCNIFVVHARRAMLNGLSPKENREIPPLRYDVVTTLRREFPQLTFVLNGGIRTVNAVLAHLQVFDGVMIGREAYQNPYLLAELHQCMAGDGSELPDRAAVLRAYGEYVERQLGRGERLSSMVRHVSGLYHALPGARSWRRFLSEGAAQPASGSRLLTDSLRIVTQPQVEMHGHDNQVLA
ncbi:MAG: tRNA dihydrouridine(20/20a) synthase DusA [Steroidobacteraceae bacterium]